MSILKVDITFDSNTLLNLGQTHMCIRCCELVRDKIKLYPDGIVELLVIVLKKYLSVKDLNSPYHGKPHLVIKILFHEKNQS